MKNWQSPQIEELDLSCTLGGGSNLPSEMSLLNSIGQKGYLGGVPIANLIGKTYDELIEMTELKNGFFKSNGIKSASDWTNIATYS